MKVFFEVWCRIEGVVEAETAHAAYHRFDKVLKNRLNESVKNPLFHIDNRPFYVNGQVSKIRCFDALTFNNLDCGEINTTPCPWCRSSEG